MVLKLSIQKLLALAFAMSAALTATAAPVDYVHGGSHNSLIPVLV
jgi:hypothetical protein